MSNIFRISQARRVSGLSNPKARLLPSSFVANGTSSASRQIANEFFAVNSFFWTPPTVALNTPADTTTVATTTPTLDFTGIASDAHTLEYNVQIDRVATFDSVKAGPVLPSALGGTSLAAWFKADAIVTTTSDLLAASAKTVQAPEVAVWAVDGSDTNWTCAFNDPMPMWWQAQLTSAKVVTGYAIRRRDDIPARNITAFTFSGSNNGTTWTMLDTHTGITWPTVGQVRSFSFSNSTAYSYYRVDITANNGDPSYASILEITFVGATVTRATVDGVPLDSWSDSSSKANHLTLTDGSSSPPIYRATGGPNSSPYLDHTVAAGGLTSPIATGMPTGDYTYFMVIQSGSVAIQSVMNAHGTPSGTAEIRLNNLHIEILQSGVASIMMSAAALAPNTWTIVLVTFTSVGSLVHFDIGGAVEDYTVGGTKTFIMNGINYANYEQNSYFFNGKMAEIGVYNSVLSSSDLAALKQYLTIKYTSSGAPMLSKLSISNPGFADVTNGADFHAFASGDQIGYTVQSIDALAAGTYYWRAADMDPSAVQSYGAWAATRSFTVTSGATGIKVWNGTTWGYKPVKVWNGSMWIAKPVKVWNGTTWVIKG